MKKLYTDLEEALKIEFATEIEKANQRIDELTREVKQLIDMNKKLSNLNKTVSNLEMSIEYSQIVIERIQPSLGEQARVVILNQSSKTQLS